MINLSKDCMIILSQFMPNQFYKQEISLSMNHSIKCLWIQIFKSLKNKPVQSVIEKELSMKIVWAGQESIKRKDNFMNSNWVNILRKRKNKI